MFEKLENCPDCGRELRQREYDLQYCERCGTGMFFRHDIPRAEASGSVVQGGVPDPNPIGGSLAVHKIGT